MPTKAISLQLATPLSEEELQTLEIYHRRSATFQETLKRLKLGEIFAYAHRVGPNQYHGHTSVPELHDLKPLLMDFRHFYLQGEPGFFHSIAGIVARRAANESVYRYMKALRLRWRNSFVESGFFEIGETVLKCREVLDLWFNAELSHSNLQKRARLERLNKVLSEELARGALFLSVYDAGLAVKGLAYSIRDLSGDKNTIYIPARYQDASGDA